MRPIEPSDIPVLFELSHVRAARLAQIEQAIESAEAEALEYAAEQPGTTFVGLAQAYRLFDEPGHGAEVFSLIRDSGLVPQTYLTRFFDTGGERQGDIAPCT